jgi:hypothetical protein
MKVSTGSTARFGLQFLKKCAIRSLTCVVRMKSILFFTIESSNKPSTVCTWSTGTLMITIFANTGGTDDYWARLFVARLNKVYAHHIIYFLSVIYCNEA